MFQPKNFRPKILLTENFAVRIAEGGSNGGGRESGSPPPAVRREDFAEPVLQIPRYVDGKLRDIVVLSLISILWHHLVEAVSSDFFVPVSYTHLTLPTNSRV